MQEFRLALSYAPFTHARLCAEIFPYRHESSQDLKSHFTDEKTEVRAKNLAEVPQQGGCGDWVLRPRLCGPKGCF